MSSIYILEPPTSGKVLLKTTVGDIDIELWAKETPKACRNFIQLCMEGYYDNTIFHRVVKGFIVQGGDPQGDGTGGESIYGAPFKDEFHQRLKFARRGLLAMANAGKDDNGSQFFFTLGPTPELQNKHTLFGKVTGETVYNMLKLEEGLIEDETPVYPHKILKTEVLNNPFLDIEPRVTEVKVKEKKKKEKKTGVKNFKLLSFGEEAEEDEEESVKVNEVFSGKGKSSHDLLDDPKLSSQTVESSETPKAADSGGESEDDGRESPEIDPAEQLEKIRNKLKGGNKRTLPKPSKKQSHPANDDDEDQYSDDDTLKRKRQKMEEIKKEIKSVKEEYHKNKLKKDEKKEEEIKEEKSKSETFKEYKEEYDTYKKKQKDLPKKGEGREEFTLKLLEKFKNRLHSVKETEDEVEDVQKSTEDDDTDIDDDKTWMQHKLHFKEDTPILAKDANTKDDDWFEIYDPRNPLNKRRRGEKPNKSELKLKK